VETLNLLFALNFAKRLEFSKLTKHLILGFNGVDPDESRIFINKGEDTWLPQEKWWSWGHKCHCESVKGLGSTS
jgi:hypothetical protein